MTPITIAYLSYLSISVLITIVVGSMLYHHGRPFLIDVFCGTERQADAANNLLLVGFYLTNIALVLSMLQSREGGLDEIGAIHLLSSNLGVVLTTLGTMHFINVFVLLHIRHINHRRTSIIGHDKSKS